MTEASTIESLLRNGTQLLRDASDAPSLDAEWILLHVLRISDSSWFYAHGDYVVAKKERHMYVHYIRQRIEGIPLAYILGWWEFYGRRFFLTKDVFIPRPLTELLVERALGAIEHLAGNFRRTIRVADIGTGSGCIAITLAHESPFIDAIVATDISFKVLAVARANARHHGVQDKIKFIHGDMFEPLSREHIDLIVSNPPYIAERELLETLQYEPLIALKGGKDGTLYTKQIKKLGIPAVLEETGARLTG